MDTSEIKYPFAKNALATTAVVKQDVFFNSIKAFETLREVSKNITVDLSQYIEPIDKRVSVHFEDKSTNEFWIQFGGDVLIFSLHTNIFTYENTHSIYQTPYIKEDTSRAYFAEIEVFNFLNDSIKYGRYNDVGELVARIFINKDNKFLVDGAGAIGVLFNDLPNQLFTPQLLETLIEKCIVQSVEYELWVPPFQEVRYLQLGAIIEKNGNLPHPTSKRLGYVIDKDMTA